MYMAGYDHPHTLSLTLTLRHTHTCSHALTHSYTQSVYDMLGDQGRARTASQELADVMPPYFDQIPPHLSALSLKSEALPGHKWG